MISASRRSKKHVAHIEHEFTKGDSIVDFLGRLGVVTHVVVSVSYMVRLEGRATELTNLQPDEMETDRHATMRRLGEVARDKGLPRVIRPAMTVGMES